MASVIEQLPVFRQRESDARGGEQHVNSLSNRLILWDRLQSDDWADSIEQVAPSFTVVCSEIDGRMAANTLFIN